MNGLSEPEATKLRKIAREYRLKGYSVEIAPHPTDPFLVGLRPDLIARSSADNVVVEIKSRQSLAGDQDLAKLAKAVENVPGWRLELVVTNPVGVAPPGDRELGGAAGRKLLNQARELRDAGMLVPALLTAWSVAEWAIRRLVSQSGTPTKTRTGPGLVRAAFSLGIVSKSAYESLMQAAHERNALSHGYAGEDRPSLRRNLNNLLASIDTLLKTPRKQRVGKRAKQSIDQLVDWFFEHYEDPANGVPYDSGEGGYQYFSGGPYDALDELAEAFPDLSEEVLSEAADLINQDSLDWVKKGQY